MNEPKKEKSLFLRILKKIKLSHIIVLTVLLIGNTYAWFIYVDTVSNSVNVQVKSWNIDVSDDQGTVTDKVTIYLDEVYPGMDTYEKNVTLSNYSNIGATVSYQILSASIMGTEYITKEGRNEYGQGLTGSELTSAQLESKLESEYPFVIDFLIDNAHLDPVDGVATYTISISWAYESGNDTLDTEWGERAYDFISTNSDEPCISLDVKISIQQDT